MKPKIGYLVRGYYGDDEDELEEEWQIIWNEARLLRYKEVIKVVVMEVE